MIQKSINKTIYINIYVGVEDDYKIWQNVKSWWIWLDCLGDLTLFLQQFFKIEIISKLTVKKNDSRKTFNIFAYLFFQINFRIILATVCIGIVIGNTSAVFLARSGLLIIAFLNRHMVILNIYSDLLFSLLVSEFAYIFNPWTLLFIYSCWMWFVAIL